MDKRMKIILLVIFYFVLLSTFTFISAYNFEDNSISVTTTLTGNLTNFTELQDTPSTYSGNGNKCVIVNAGATALVFGDCSTGGGVTWANIINGTMATWQQVMNGTVSGGGITWNTATNGTLALNSSLVTYSSSINEPRWADNFSKYNTTWSSTYNVTYAGYNSTGLIKDWNSSGHIKDWNGTGLIINWSTGGQVELDPKAYNGTLAYNTSLALYYPLVNPYNFYNLTSFDINNYYLKTNPYNYWNDTFALFNKTYADTLYAPVSEPKAYNGTLVTVTVDTATNTSLYNWIVAQSYTAGAINWLTAMNGTLAKTTDLSSYYLLTNPYAYYNLTNPPTESDPKAYNGTLVTVAVDATTNTSLYNWVVAQSYTAGASTWVQAMNGTLAKTTDLASYSPITEPKWTDNFTLYNVTWGANGISWATATNGTLALNSSLATYSASVTWGYNMTTPAITYANASYLKLTGGNMTGNINMSSYNITLNNGTTNGRLCLTQTCNSYIYNNGTGVVIQG